MKTIIKSIIYISIIPLLISLYFFDNIRGYYRFKELCAAHKEVVVYQKLEPNVGWQIDTNETESRDVVKEFLYFIPQISFLRFKDYSVQQIYDSRFVGSSRLFYEQFNRTNYLSSERDKNAYQNKNSIQAYEFKTANLEEKPVYQLEEFHDHMPNELRIGRGGYRIRDLRTNKVLVVIEDIGYGEFDQDKTILAAPSAVLCRRRPVIFSVELSRQIFTK